MLILLFSITILLSAGIAIFAKYQENPRYFQVAKPITTSLIIAFAAIGMTTRGIDYSYGTLILIGLGFSLIGDVFLLKEKYFVHGLGAFLCAHILFALAFISLEGMQYDLIPLLILGSIALAYYYFLFPNLSKMAIPVGLYILAIIFMAWQACSLGTEGIFLWIAISALLFAFSDAVIAYAKFVHRFHSAEVWILSTYWTSIYLLALSCHFMIPPFP